MPTWSTDALLPLAPSPRWHLRGVRSLNAYLRRGDSGRCGAPLGHARLLHRRRQREEELTGIFFFLNAVWWAYRAAATVSKGYLDFLAAENRTTLDLAFTRAFARERERGVLGAGNVALLQFVQFNNKWAWDNPTDFAIDTAAVGTAGLGLLTKTSLGKRVLTVMGVKHAVPLGAIIDGVIDFVGVMISPGANPGDALKKLLGIISRTQKGVDPTLDAFNNVVRATTGLGQIIAPLVGSGIPTGPVGIFRIVAQAPAILNGVTNVFASLLGLWGAVEPFIPQAKTVLPVDPQFRDQVRKFNRSKILPLDPGLRRGLEPSRTLTTTEIKGRPRIKAKFEGRREVAPDTGDPLSDDVLELLLLAQDEGKRLPDGIEIKTMLVPGEIERRGSFLSRFRGRSATDLQEILRELKKRG